MASSCALLLATGEGLALRARVADLRDSQLWLMPRVTVEAGQVVVEGPPGRVLDARDFVLLLDAESDAPIFPEGAAGDVRPRLLVGRQGLMLYRKGRSAPTLLPWSELSASEGRLSLDGPELVDWLEQKVVMLVAGLASAVLALFLLYQCLVLLFLGGLYRVVLFRGLYVPGLRSLFVVGCLASIPALVGATALLALGLSPGMSLACHALCQGVLFFLGATRLRLMDEQTGEPNHLGTAS